jgi:hypothetical protein
MSLSDGLKHRVPGIGERSVHAIAEQVENASAVVDDAHAAGLDGSHPVTLQPKMLRLELLNVKADLERDLGRLVLHCTDCGRIVHWVPVLPQLRDTGHTVSQRRMGAPLPLAA